MSNLLTIKEVSEKLKVQPQTIRKWIKARKIAFVELPGRGKRIKEDNLNNWIDQKVIKAKTNY